MSLKMDKEVDGGFTANHWYIEHATCTYSTGKLHITMQLYKDKAARLAGKGWVKQERFVTAIPKFFEWDKILDLIKGHEYFKDATDDEEV